MCTKPHLSIFKTVCVCCVKLPYVVCSRSKWSSILSKWYSASDSLAPPYTPPHRVLHEKCVQATSFEHECLFSIQLICPIWHTDVKRRFLLGIALGYGLDNGGSRDRFPAWAGNCSLHHRIQNGSGAHPASYPMGTRDSFPRGKAAGAWSWPLTSI
jgi:hypothetical protein